MISITGYDHCTDLGLSCRVGAREKRRTIKARAIARIKIVITCVASSMIFLLMWMLKFSFDTDSLKSSFNF